jgi:hypothetical protein
MPLEDAEANRPSGKLLFKPTEFLSVTSATRDVTFEPVKDLILDGYAGTISLPAGSRIPVITRERLYPLMSSNVPKLARKSGNRKRRIFFDEGSA